MRLVLRPDGAPPIPMLFSLSERAALTAFLKGDAAASGPATQWREPTIFRRAPKGALHREAK